MANPVRINLPEWTWVKIAEKINDVKIYRLATTVYYYKTYRQHAQSPPSVPIKGEVPDDAIPIFSETYLDEIKSSELLDVYILCANNDNDSNEIGSIIVGEVGDTSGLNIEGEVVVIDTFNNKVLNHEIFSISKRFTIAKSSSITIVIDPIENGPFIKEDFQFLPLFIQAAGGGPVNIDLYAGVDSDTDGTIWESIDRNTVDPLTAHIVTRLNPTINNIGLKVPTEFQIPSNGTPATSTIGGEVKENFLLVPRKDIRYAFILENLDAVTAVNCIFAFNWIEA